MPVKINGSTSGSVTLAAPATGSDVTLTLPAATGTAATTANVTTAVAPMGLVAVAPTSIANSGGSASLSDYTVSFSGVSSVSLNGVFSATYQNYLITWDLTTSASVEVLMRFRASSTDDTSSNYKMTHNRTSGSGGVDLSETIAYIPIGFTGDTVRRIGTMTVFGPYDASATFFMDQNYSACGTPNTGITGGRLDVAASKDGFTIYPVSGNITGIVRVYGYKGA